MKYLINSKISGDRIKIEGKGCSNKLFLNPKNGWEIQQNSRIEIEILEM